MIAGGNGNAREGFGEITLNINDLKSKYTSKTAVSYRNKLKKKAIQIVQEQPSTVQQQQQQDNLIDFDQPQQPQQQQNQSLIDFDDDNVVQNSNLIDDFDIFKPITKQNAKPASPQNDTKTSIFDDLMASPPPAKQTTVFNDLLSPSINTKNNISSLIEKKEDDNDPFDAFIASPKINNPDTVVNDFFDQFEKVTPTAPAATVSQKKRTLKPPKSHHSSKLGARKVQSNVFQQQTQLAMREEKMREQGVDEESIGRNSRNQAMMMDQSVIIPKLQKPSSTRLNYVEAKIDKNAVDTAVENERLGLMSLNLNDNNKSTSRTLQNDEDNNNDHYARDKFGNAKAISSDQYFGRNNYNPQRAAANESRLAQFEGSQSISSDQYFGRKSSEKFTSSSSNPISKKILRAAIKGATKIQNTLADMEVN
jgi:ADP-ribosylation factor GTPase-activating protein 2/3